MTWIKRISLFALVNILVMVTVSLAFFMLGQLGFQIPLSGIGNGTGIVGLAISCLIWGSVGSFVSLLISRWMAKRMMGVRVIEPETGGFSQSNEQWLVQTVHELARRASLPAMPEVGIYDSPEVNAFATGPSKSRSLVAVSSGLLTRMNRSQVEGVLAHEVAHIANGDMVTMALIQGIVNAFVMFFARIVAMVVGQSVEERNRYMVQFAVTIVLQIVFGLFGSMVVAAFSRWREFRADAGGAQFAGREKMVGALQALQSTTEMIDGEHPQLASFKIAGGGSIMALFSTHPPLEVRIARLKVPGTFSGSRRSN